MTDMPETVTDHINGSTNGFPKSKRNHDMLVAVRGLCVAVVALIALAVAYRGQQQTEDLQHERAQSSRDSGCRSKYLSDVLQTGAAYDAAFGLLVITAVQTPASGGDPTARKAIFDALVADLNTKNSMYQKAIDANSAYTAMTPPPDECPHP